MWRFMGVNVIDNGIKGCGTCGDFVRGCTIGKI